MLRKPLIYGIFMQRKHYFYRSRSKRHRGRHAQPHGEANRVLCLPGTASNTSFTMLPQTAFKKLVMGGA
jgi:hypothetical protein